MFSKKQKQESGLFLSLLKINKLAGKVFYHTIIPIFREKRM
jgi:hypothetical protein